MPKKINKSAKTGKIVSEEFADANPDETYETEVEIPVKVKKVETFVPAIGEKFELDGRVAEVVNFDPLQVIEHRVMNGCQTQSKLLVENLVGAKALDKDEAFRRLA